MSDLHDLERDIAARRSRLSDTIDRIQDKLTVAGIVDEVMGQAGAARLATSSNAQLSRFLQRYPLPVMVAAAGIGFYLYRRARKPPVASTAVSRPVSTEVIDVPVGLDVPAGLDEPVRVYDPDAPRMHPDLDQARPLGRRPDLQA